MSWETPKNPDRQQPGAGNPTLGTTQIMDNPTRIHAPNYPIKPDDDYFKNVTQRISCRQKEEAVISAECSVVKTGSVAWPEVMWLLGKKGALMCRGRRPLLHSVELNPQVSVVFWDGSFSISVKHSNLQGALKHTFQNPEGELKWTSTVKLLTIFTIKKVFLGCSKHAYRNNQNK